MHAINLFLLYWKPFLWCLISFTVICLTNQLFILPISGIYLLGYVIIITVSTTWVSFISIQNFLSRNKSVDLLKLLKLKPQNVQKSKVIDGSSITKLSEDINEHFVKKWFIYISKDLTFSKESKDILMEVLDKVFKVQASLHYPSIVQGILTLHLKHLKEFRRSLKRKEKYQDKITKLYRYSHICTESRKAQEFYIHQLTTTLLNHFINWELGNSLPYRILVSTISRKVTLNAFNAISNPEFLNYCLLKFCASSGKIKEFHLEDYNRIRIVNVTENVDSESGDLSKTSSTSNLSKKGESRDEVDCVKQVETTEEKFVLMPPPEIKQPLVEEKKYEEIKSEDVKIYEPTKACKTWYDSYDLNSVTLGQDILDMIDDADQDQETDKDELSTPLTSAKNLFDEVKQMTSLEGIKTSMKPISDVTVSTVKDLQESTSTALHKIGGLHLQDEAAGVVEGLLDFGRTKIRKGLRLTGLQDDSDEDLPKVIQKKNIIKMPHVRSLEKNEDNETAWINPLMEEREKKLPSILTHDDSPEPEYEEAADLATSIAKLRSLLEQKSSGSNLSTPSGLSPMPSDDLSSKLFMESELVDEPDRMMPSFYKFCTKTATGVIHNTLNTIKTALPGNIPGDRFDGMEKWLFVESNSSNSDFFARMEKTLCERKDFCTVDTAYEAFSLESFQREKLRQKAFDFEDDLDDFELKLPISRVIFDTFCELLADNKNTSLAQEPVIKSMLLLFGNFIEEAVSSNAESAMHSWCNNAKVPAEENLNTLSLEFDVFVDILLSGIPDYAKYLIGERTLKDATQLFVSSLQVQKINQDMVIQIFEIICIKLIEGSKHLSPPISA